MIDEYDGFANTILAHRGPEAYESFTQAGGFYHRFFANLKADAGESGGGIERLFVTGVSPIPMGDLSLEDLEEWIKEDGRNMDRLREALLDSKMAKPSVQ